MQFLRSYRFRLISLSLVVNALALIFFTGLAWYFLKSQLESGQKQKLEAFLVRSVPQMQRMIQTGQRWPESRAMGQFEGRLEQANLFFAYRFPSGEWFTSGNWPEILDVSDATWPDKMTSSYTSDEWPLRREGRPGRVDREGQRGLEDPVFFEKNGFLLAGIQLRRSLLILGTGQETVSEEWKRMRSTLLWAFPFSMLAVGAGAFFLSGRALRPIRKLTKAAQSLHLDRLHHGIVANNEDAEFAELIEVFNEMADRLTRSYVQAKRFTQDAAHELNTPLTLLIGHLDEILHETEHDSENQKRLESVYKESLRLRDIVRKLHTLAQADRGGLPVVLESVSIATLLGECLEDVAAAFPAIQFGPIPENIPRLQADASLLRQVLMNLLSNAAKFNRPEGKIWFLGQSEDDFYRLEVWNEGKAIPEDLKNSIFARFVRGDLSRAKMDDASFSKTTTDEAKDRMLKTNSYLDQRNPAGLGLGLSLASELSKAMGGELKLIYSVENKTGFALILPLAPISNE